LPPVALAGGVTLKVTVSVLPGASDATVAGVVADVVQPAPGQAWKCPVPRVMTHQLGRGFHNPLALSL